MPVIAAPAPFPAITAAQRRTLIAAALGWMLDSFDVMLYSMILPYAMRDLRISPAQAGILNTLTLVASGFGGVLFGYLADRIGRRQALMLSIGTYSLCSFGSSLSNGVLMLATFRFILGLGMGGEWNTGATLVAETWPTHLRAKAMAVVQSCWALGFALAALVSGVVLKYFDWRVVFFVGVLPALVTLWIRGSVPESELWLQRRARAAASPHAAGESSFWRLFSSRLRRPTLALLGLNFFGLFAWWGLFAWIPSYLALPLERGGRGFSLIGTTTLLVLFNMLGMFPGYVTFGWWAERFGRRAPLIGYTLAAALLVPFYAMARNPITILLLGIVLAYFGAGFFSGSGIVGSEVFPTGVRSQGLGFTFNGARLLSSVAPFLIGWLGQQYGLSGAFFLCALGFFLASLSASLLPETKGRQLQES